MKSKYLALIGCAGVMMLAAGCATVSGTWSQHYLFSSSSTASIQRMSAHDLYSVPNNDLCAAYNGTMSPIIKAEMQRRALITSDFTWNDVNHSKTWNGMSLCDLLASQGKPDNIIKGETFMELDYDSSAYQVENGEVTKISQVQSK